MSAAEPEPDESRVLSLLGWAGRTDVERVQRYTEISLHTMLWIFLVLYVGPVLTRLDDPVHVVGTVAVVLVLALVGGRAVRRCTTRWPARGVPWREPWFVALLVVLAGAVGWSAVVQDPQRIGLPMGIAMTAAWGLGGLRGNAVHAAVLAFCGLQAWAVTGVFSLALVVTGFAAFMLFTMQSSLWLLGVVRELDRARRTESELAVAQERLRFSSDVHDVMGRHLSTIAVQAELAGALLRKGDERAGERIEQVRATAHDALREARELARGYRPLDLTREIEGAVSLLASAGVTASVTPDPLAPVLAEHWHEPVAKVVREAVTNVLRHSRATTVTVRLEGLTLRITNDGVEGARSGPDGSGLATLRRQVEPLGGALTSERRDDTFTLCLTLPVTDVIDTPENTNERSAR